MSINLSRLLAAALLFITLVGGTPEAGAQSDHPLLPAMRGNLPGKEGIIAPRIEKVDDLPCGFRLESIIIERRGFLVEVKENGRSRFLYLIPDDKGAPVPHPDSWLPCQATLDVIIKLISPPESPWQWDSLPDNLNSTESEKNPCNDAVWNRFEDTEDWPAGWQPEKAECSNTKVSLLFSAEKGEPFSVDLKRDAILPWVKSNTFSLTVPPPQITSREEAAQLKKALENLYSYSTSDSSRLEGALADSMPFSTPADWIGTFFDGRNYSTFGVHPSIVVAALLLFVVLVSVLVLLNLPGNRSILTGGLILLVLALGIRTAFGIFGPCNFRSDIFGGNMQHPFNFGTAYPAFQAVLFYIFGRSLQVIYWSNALISSLSVLLSVWWLRSLKVKDSVAWIAGILIAIAPANVWVGTSDAHQNMIAFLALWLLLATVYSCNGRHSLLWLLLVPLTSWLIIIWRPEAIVYPALSLGPAVLAGLRNAKGRPYKRWAFIFISIAAVCIWGVIRNTEHMTAGAVNIRLSGMALLWPRYGWIAPLAGLPVSLLVFAGVLPAFKKDRLTALLFVLLCIGVLLPFSSMIWSPMTPHDRMVYRYFTAAMPFFMFFAAWGLDFLASMGNWLAIQFLPRPGENIITGLMIGLLLLLSLPDYRYDLSLHDEIRSLDKVIERLDPACPLHFVSVDGVFGALAPTYYLPWLHGKDINLKTSFPEDDASCLYYWKPPLCDLPPDLKLTNDEKPEWVAPVWEICEKWRNMKGLRLLKEFETAPTVAGFAESVPGIKAGLYYRAGDKKGDVK